MKSSVSAEDVGCLKQGTMRMDKWH